MFGILCSTLDEPTAQFVHGAHLNYSDKIPLSNLFVTISNQLSRPAEKFADSTADITEVLG